MAELSFRKTAENIKTMCNQEISPQDVWKVVQTVGKKISEIEERKIELNEKGVLKGEKKVPVLFQEQDGVWLSIQGKDKPEGKSKKYNEYKINTAPIPYSRVAVSLGREVIQNFCGLKGFGDISYN